MTNIDREALARALYDSDVTGIFMLPAQREARWIGQREGYLHHVGALAPLIAAAVDAARAEGDKQGAARVREAVEAVCASPDDVQEWESFDVDSRSYDVQRVPIVAVGRIRAALTEAAR